MNIVGSGGSVGALAGSSNGPVVHCYSTGRISGTGDFVGGLVGSGNGNMANCYSTATVSGDYCVGGLVGSNGGHVTYCYSTGVVSGMSSVGGLAGSAATVAQCYSVGAVSGGWDVGGLVGRGGAETNCFWDTQTSRQAASAGGTGRTTAQMRDIATYRRAGWDFWGESKDGLHEIWQMPEGGGYPVLAVFCGYTPPQLQGSGSPDSPYLISNAVELGAIVHHSPGGHYRLTASIDLSGICWGTAAIPWFAGAFDGNSYTISHLTIKGESLLGLFGGLESGAEVKNLGAVAVDVTGTGSGVGGLVGVNDGTVTQCYCTGAVSGKSNVGGLVGYNGTGTVTRCYSTGVVSGTGWYVGGLVGHNWAGTLTRCYCTGAVSGGWDVGGLVGWNGYHGTVAQCYSTGAVSGKGSVGGLVGVNQGSVLHSVWDMETSGRSRSAGGVALTTGEMMDPYMLGLNGFADDPNWVVDAGRDYPRLAWLGTLGQLIPAPQIDWLAGRGTLDEPYRIDTADQLIFLGRASALCDKHLVLGADINLDPNLASGQVFAQAVVPAFTGVFDGKGHRIAHLTVTGNGDYVGLFGRLASGSEVRNLGVVDVNVAGSGWRVGGLVGWNDGLVTQCYSTGVVSGTGWSVGGLVGENNSGHVTQCYSTGAVSGTGPFVGGLVGVNNSGHVTQCYSTGTVKGNDHVGGLVGRNTGGTVTQCYSTGTVKGNDYVGGLIGDSWVTVDRCFWDTQTSGQATSDGGTGKTTVEMRTSKTFLDAGWDFVGETANGSEDIWWIREGKDYPRLAWEFWAFSPDPWNGATDVIQSPTLSWLAGRRTVSHDVYFGENKTVVTNATSANLGIYRGRQPVEMVTYDLGALELGKSYYWRVDEVNEANPNSPWKGSVWMFSTSDFSVVAIVDDFESYVDDINSVDAIFRVWADGYGCGVCKPRVVGNGTGSIVGNMNPPYAEQQVMHGGRQSMPMDYNNVTKPWYSEAQRTWATPQDWAVDGADTLTLYSRGKADNGRERLYVGIEDSAGRIAVVVHPDAEAVRATEWQKWHIALADVRAAGVDVAAVKKMVIGVGDRKNPKPGGTGRIYIDDIRLTKRMP